VHSTTAASEESDVDKGDISKVPIFAFVIIGSAAMRTISYVGLIVYEGAILQ